VENDFQVVVSIEEINTKLVVEEKSAQSCFFMYQYAWSA